MNPNFDMEIGEEVYTSMRQFEQFIGFDSNFVKKEICEGNFEYWLGGRVVGYYDDNENYAKLCSLY